jgi:uncharacterized protein YfaS (alpha-2-macroglobulin family)
MLSIEEVKAGQMLDSRSLYLDEVSIDSSLKNVKFLLAEVPLPPGGEVDGKTWGLQFEGFVPHFVDPRPFAQGLGYAIPIETLESGMKFHQLVRFSSRGRFKLPPVKLSRMYRPSEKVFTKGDSLSELQVK